MFSILGWLWGPEDKEKEIDKRVKRRMEEDREIEYRMQRKMHEEKYREEQLREERSSNLYEDDYQRRYPQSISPTMRRSRGSPSIPSPPPPPTNEYLESRWGQKYNRKNDYENTKEDNRFTEIANKSEERKTFTNDSMGIFPENSAESYHEDIYYENLAKEKLIREIEEQEKAREIDDEDSEESWEDSIDEDSYVFLETMNIEEIKLKETFFELIYPFPKTLSIDKYGEFFELKAWLYNTVDAINIWHLHYEKPKLDYIKCMRYLSFKIREITLFYYDHFESYKKMGLDKTKYTVKDKREKLFNWRNSTHEHIQSLLNEYPSRFAKKTTENNETFIDESKKCLCLCKKHRFNEIKSIQKSLETMQLTEDQYNIFRNDYMNKLFYLDHRKRKFKKLFCLSNCSLQIGSVLLPALITIKDNTGLEDVPYLKATLDTSAIILSIIMGIITNLTVFFKVNQRYSLYTQYDNKLKQEIRRFITYSEKYNDDEVGETYRLFPQFSLAIENYIEELSNQEYDYIVGNKEKDSSANVKGVKISSQEEYLNRKLTDQIGTDDTRDTISSTGSGQRKKKKKKKEKEQSIDENNENDENDNNDQKDEDNKENNDNSGHKKIDHEESERKKREETDFKERTKSENKNITRIINDDDGSEDIITSPNEEKETKQIDE